MYSLSNAFKTFAPMLIEPAKAKAYLDKVASISPADLKAGEDLEQMMEMIFGHRPEMMKSGPFAVIPVKGVIGSGLTELEKMMGATDVEDIEEMLEDAERDEAIEHIIFDFDSPGGTVTGVPEMADRIRNSPKHTVGWTNKQSCSASFWLMSQCDEVYVSPSSMVGSVGVYMATYDMTRAYEAEGIKVDVIKAGWAKAAGYPGTTMSDEQRKLFQEDVNETHEWFKGDVMEVRSYSDAADMEGQAWSGKKAAEKNLVSGMMNTFDDLLEHINPVAYQEAESQEKKVPSIGPSEYGDSRAKAADVSPEQGETEGKKKKKKKKPDGTDSDEDEDEGEAAPIETDKLPKS